MIVKLISNKHVSNSQIINDKHTIINKQDIMINIIMVIIKKWTCNNYYVI